MTRRFCMLLPHIHSGNQARKDVNYEELKWRGFLCPFYCWRKRSLKWKFKNYLQPTSDCRKGIRVRYSRLLY